MKKQLLCATALCLAVGAANAQNLLLNGDFNLPGDGSSATDWASWAWGGGWANTEIAAWTFDGSYQLTAGGYGASGGGSYQLVSAAEGLVYSLSVESGAEAWWLPTGRMTMFFLDASANTISSVTQTTVDPAVYGMNNDIAHAWQVYTLTGTAPAGTTQIKVEFSANETSASGQYGETGSVGFDNAILTVQSVPEPGVAALSILGGSLLLFAYRSRRNANRA